MFTKNIMIIDMKPQFTAEYIANTLWKREIAKVSSITLIPQIKNEEISYIAYIDIDSFCETEAAYDFVYHMYSGHFVFCHNESDVKNEDNFWILKKNIHNSGNLRVGPYTTTFMSDFFKYDIMESTGEFDGINPNYDDDFDSLSTDLDEELEWYKIPDEVCLGGNKKLIEWMNSKPEVAMSIDELDV